MQIRFQFYRGKELKFIGHLDILRLFERAFKRADLSVAHSRGYNPRPQIIFGQPMPLGLTSEGEFADVELDLNYTPDAFVQKMNSSLPPGIQIMAAWEKTSPFKLMRLIDAARYRIGFNASEEFEMNQIINAVEHSKEINVTKKTKSGEKEINIRPYIFRFSGNKNGLAGDFLTLLGAGQDNNIRPELFIAGVSKVTGIQFEMKNMHRFMLYAAENKKAGSVSGSFENKWIALNDKKLL